MKIYVLNGKVLVEGVDISNDDGSFHFYNHSLLEGDILQIFDFENNTKEIWRAFWRRRNHYFEETKIDWVRDEE